MDKSDEIYMKRAIEIAKKGIGWTNPNPLVGAVVVKDGKVIKEGYHKRLGEAHAERDALSSMGEEARGASLYVNLEPCSHYGRTPPCVDIIKEKGISRVIVGMEDPNPKVRGKGIEILRKSGIEVVAGVLEKESKKLNEIFIKYITSQNPFVIIKSAMTLDGKIASNTGDSFWISGDKSREEVHNLRQRVSSIMVGVNTVINDNPKLNVRLKAIEPKHPIRIVVDSSGRIPIDSYLVETAMDIPTWVATTSKMKKGKEEELTKKGVEVIKTSELNGRVNIKELMHYIHDREVDSVLIEGGSTLNAAVIGEGIADKIIMYIAPKIIGGKNAPTPVGGMGINAMKNAISLHSVDARMADEDMCIEGYISKQPWEE